MKTFYKFTTMIASFGFGWAMAELFKPQPSLRTFGFGVILSLSALIARGLISDLK